MKIDFSQQLKNLDGSPIDGLTLKKVATDALITVQPGDESISAIKKFERGKLAFKIHETNGESMDISVEELGELKTLIGRTYGPLVIAQAFDMIEGGSKS